MPANKTSMDPDLDNDRPDLSTPIWADTFAAAPLTRGRPKSTSPKVSTTIRLDADVIAAFKSSGQGWQGRINAALRKAAALP